MIKILDYVPVNKNKVIGYADIMVPITQPVNVIFRNIAHLENEGKRWFNLPQLCRELTDDKKIFLKYAQFEMESHNRQMLESINDLIKEYCIRNNIKEISPLNFNSNAKMTSENDCPF